MKKLLIFTLVFGLTSLVSAGVELSVDGNTQLPDPPDPAAELQPSETVVIDVHATYGQTDAPEDFWLGLTGPGEWLMDTAVTGPAAGTPAGVVSDGGYGPAWIWMSYSDTIPAPGSWEDGMMFAVELHCLGEGDVIVDLYDPTGGTIIDSVLIHQVPEPATMGLLALGGLFLRRRK